MLLRTFDVSLPAFGGGGGGDGAAKATMPEVKAILCCVGLGLENLAILAGCEEVCR